MRILKVVMEILMRIMTPVLMFFFGINLLLLLFFANTLTVGEIVVLVINVIGSYFFAHDFIGYFVKKKVRK